MRQLKLYFTLAVILCCGCKRIEQKYANFDKQLYVHTYIIDYMERPMVQFYWEDKIDSLNDPKIIYRFNYADSVVNVLKHRAKATHNVFR